MYVLQFLNQLKLAFDSSFDMIRFKKKHMKKNF